MTFSIEDLELKIKKALQTINDCELFELSKTENLNIRRAVARNPFCPSHIIDTLANDPVANVSVVALQHRNCTIKRDIDKETLNHKCVSCQISEISALTKCLTCENQ